MAESDEDEFASNFDASTTPFRQVTVAKDTNPTKTKLNNRHVAGPSKPSSRGKRKRSPTPSRNEGEGDIQEVVDTEVELSRPARSRRGGNVPGPSRQHGPSKTNTARRGKAKVESDAQSRATVETIDFDDSEVNRANEESEPETDDRVQTQPRPHPGTKVRQNVESARALAAKSQKEERTQRQFEQLRKRLEQVTATRDSLAQQLEEVFRTRNTEPEEALEQQAVQYETRLKTQEEMIQELTTQLARIDSLTREGKTSTLHFLTREAADEERRGVETELTNLRAALRMKEKELADKDAQIRSREDTIQTLRSDLRVEIENTKAIMSRSNIRDPPSSATKSKPNVLPKQDPKHALIVRLYEDLTNFLVMNIKADMGKTSGNSKSPDETIYKCVYTSDNGRSLTFDLRYYISMSDSGDNVENVLYTPMELENEPDQEFVQSLNMLAESFTFSRAQMDEFFKQLRLIVGGEDDGNVAEEDEE